MAAFISTDARSGAAWAMTFGCALRTSSEAMWREGRSERDATVKAVPDGVRDKRLLAAADRHAREQR